MSEAPREIEGPGEPLRLRPAEAEDDVFQRALFSARRGAVFRGAGLPAPMISSLLEMQYRARTQSYRQDFPAARWLIVERDGRPIGELIIEDAKDALHIVDITLHPEHQGCGIGPALVRALMDGACGVRAMAALGNAPSRKMFARLGFVERDLGDGANVELLWRP